VSLCAVIHAMGGGGNPVRHMDHKLT
jgi:hypothetical protein